MRITGCLILTICALAWLGPVGCGSDGYTPKCTPPDYADCLEPPKGGTYFDAPDDTTDAGHPD